MPEGELSAINKRLKEVRKALKINQRIISNVIGVKQSYYSDVENGRRNLTEKVKHELKEKYGVNEDWLYTGKGEMFLPHSDHKRTLNPVPPLYPPAPNEQDFAKKSKFYLMYKFRDLIKEQYPVYNELMKDVLEILSINDLIDDLHESKVGDVLFFGVESLQKVNNFKEYKDIGFQTLDMAIPHKQIIHDFAEAIRKFISELQPLKEVLDIEFDFEEYYQEEDPASKE